MRASPGLRRIATPHPIAVSQLSSSIAHRFSTNQARPAYAKMEAPYVAQDPYEISQVVGSLEQLRKEKGKSKLSAKKTTFSVKGSQGGIQVDSWKFSDWDYKRRDLPIYARGLFTTRHKNQTEIAVRGYDKFFNVDEVHETKWDNILSKTQGPYELTLKENGCIIFIAGLADETLLVCSKHSLGDRVGVKVSHAKAGEDRLEQQLAAVGKTKADLARELYAKNITAVAELCDDSFEEHILAYGPDKAGLYLHGINLNVPRFTTYPSPAVQQFADDWAFVKTNFIVMEDVNEVKKFLEDVANTGAYDGRDVEGFVIRCKMSENPGGKIPYHDWFFKYKFEEPYLMYRQWRECTKAIISGKQPRFKKHARITEEYLLYVKKRLRGDPQLAKSYNENHGIIALREGFLEYKNINGADAANMEESDPLVMTEVTGDVILCPISTIGCGKTTLALALTHLFGWGHIQNDNISGKGRPPRFTKAVLDELKEHPVVFADRNNASKHERKQILTDVGIQHGGAKMVCLNFRFDDDTVNEIRYVTQQRIIDRGDNHQTIHAASDPSKFLAVMDGFIKRLEPCDPIMRPDMGFDLFIDLDPVGGSRKNLETIITQLHSSFPNLVKEVPDSSKLDEAIAFALAYKPEFRHDVPDRGNKSKSNAPENVPDKAIKRRLEYMSIEVPRDAVNSILEEGFRGSDNDVSRMYKQLKQTRRVQPSFHVTLMHRASAKQHPELWERYCSLFEAAGSTGVKLGQCDVVLERVCCALDNGPPQLDYLLTFGHRLYLTTALWPLLFALTTRIKHGSV